ncbi:GIN domain-containing protein [uncultured Hymenobacter sp.]|uniref:GIN domain-containing protein n=1 Tax=uncultured Hymenobacter sp. TaxID=170016 RepID=UPI0035CA366D
MTFLRPQVSPVGRLGRAGLGRGFNPARGVGRLLLALTAALSACGSDTNCLTSTGPIRTERRELPTGLRSVYASDNVDLILVQDTVSAPYMEVRAGKNLLSSLETRVEGDQLTLTNNARCNWARTYDSPREVRLHVPHIENVFLRGSGNISTAGQFRQKAIFFHLQSAGDMDLDIQSDYLWIDLYELGDVRVQGQTRELNLTVDGNGRFFGQNLRARQCYFTTTRGGNGDAHVLATEALGGTIAGNGTVYYAGNPAYLDLRLTGPGQAQRVP